MWVHVTSKPSTQCPGSISSLLFSPRAKQQRHLCPVTGHSIAVNLQTRP